MKPTSKRHPDLPSRSTGELSASRMASVLTHENRLLRARLEGRGRIEVDPALRQEHETTLAENRRLISELQRTKGELERSRQDQVELRRRLQSQNQQLPNVVNRVAGLSEQLNRQNDRLRQLTFEIRDAEERAGLGAELSAAVDRIGELESELERTRTELGQARTDIGRLLLRLRSTPLVLLLRRSAGFRAIESRWDGR